MRIIAGEHRGRRIEAPPGKATRPMLDRVREALFSTLGNLVEDARVLDLFAGSGSLGLEALSRGAEFAFLVERERACVRVLRSNVETLALGDRARVVVADALDPASWGEGERFDVVFLDPPYPWVRDRRRRGEVLETARLLVREHLDPSGVLVLHVPRGELVADDLGDAVEARLREYGSNALWYLRPKEPETA